MVNGTDHSGGQEPFVALGYIMKRSIVEYLSEHDGYKCGYCKKTDTNYSHGMWANELTVCDYQELIDRGWRRSGKYCYKPTMDLTCCPSYTIRCRVNEFKLTKSQKKICNKFCKYLKGSEMEVQPLNCAKESLGSGDRSDGMPDVAMGEEFVESNKVPQDINVNDVNTMISEEMEQDNEKSNVEIKVNRNNESGSNDHMDVGEKCGIDAEVGVSKDSQSTMKGQGSDAIKGPCKKAKQLRIERKIEKMKAKGMDISNLEKKNKNEEKQIEDFISELPENKLEIRLVRTHPPSPEWTMTFKETHALYVKYQMAIHGDKPEKCHISKFHDFLVSSPLIEEYGDNAPPCGYGSFHQQYCIDNKIIAVGVVDILPKCVSSVYFFYDPKYADLTIGTYGALREIAFTRYLSNLSPQLQYYYMGFYIHTCPKMRYKGNFHPSDLLCPDTYKWFPIKECIPKIDASPYSRLNPDIDALDDNECSAKELNYLRIVHRGAIMVYKDFKRKCKKNIDEELLEYMRLVGAKTAPNMLLVKS